ncbi:MAG: type II toxin-antitoxin system RelE/ParE family toxin [Arcobacteraceae bacterium]|nr:type II toxin-antitoxin system RelE/ParE family toxin [Arcobacteraceae bacterium]
MIEKNPAFDDSLFAILKYIANDSPNNARKFKSKIDRTIKNLLNMPFNLENLTTINQKM